MKQSDIFTLIIIASVGILASYFGVRLMLGDPDEAYVQYKTIQAITPELVEPDPELFNQSAINPTVEVYVGKCVDADQNGILSQAELIQCGSTSAAGTEQSTQDAQNADQDQNGGSQTDSAITETQSSEGMPQTIETNGQSGGN